MKKELRFIAILILMLALLLSGCGTAPENENIETTVPTEAIAEATEPEEIEPDPEWFTDAAIDEAYACLFPLEGEKKVELARDILLPLVEVGNAEAQYYWAYICDYEVVDNNGEEEKESLYWYELAAEQGYAKAYLGVAINAYVDSEEKKAGFIDAARQAGVFEMSAEELGADGCKLIAGYYHLEENDTEAFAWCQKSAEMGSAAAMSIAGMWYYDGTGVDQDILLSVEWLTKAANKGDINAMHYLGYVLSREETAKVLIDEEYAANADEYQDKAAVGDAEAMYHLGKMNEMGYGGISKNVTKALEWYRKSAEAGCADAMFKMGSAYEEGSIMEKNYESSQEWYQKAADAGHATAMYILGESYMETDPETAIVWYQKAANAGNTDAMEVLGDIYQEGIYVQQDIMLGSDWYWKAHEIRKKGDIMQYSDYGKIMYTGIEWEQKAADAGHATAMNNIGFYHKDGREKFYDSTHNGYFVFPEDAIVWYQKAANEGNDTAMFNLGWRYKEDSYLEENSEDLAMEWFVKAYANGHDGAAEQIKEMLTNKQGVNAYFENYGEWISASP